MRKKIIRTFLKMNLRSANNINSDQTAQAPRRRRVEEANAAYFMPAQPVNQRGARGRPRASAGAQAYRAAPADPNAQPAQNAQGVPPAPPPQPQPEPMPQTHFGYP